MDVTRVVAIVRTTAVRGKFTFRNGKLFLLVCLVKVLNRRFHRIGPGALNIV